MDIVGETLAVDEAGLSTFRCSKWKVTGSVTIGGSPSGTGSRIDGSSFVEGGSDNVSSV